MKSISQSTSSWLFPDAVKLKRSLLFETLLNALTRSKRIKSTGRPLSSNWVTCSLVSRRLVFYKFSLEKAVLPIRDNFIINKMFKRRIIDDSLKDFCNSGREADRFSALDLSPI